MMKELQKDDPWSVPFNEAEAANVTERLLRDPSLGRVWFIAADGQTHRLHRHGLRLQP